MRIPVGRGFAGRIAAERRPVAIEDVDHADILNPILREKGIRSLLGVPLLVEGRVIGVLHVGSLTRRIFGERDRDLLQLAADRAAIAIEHARLHAQRHIVEAMQHAMLPAALPVIPGIQFTATYRPAAVDARVGGDWYDVFELGRGRIALVIGDVVGRGVEAGALMAQVRTALRAYALEGHPPATVVDLLNRLFSAERPTKLTTVAYLVLDPEAGQLVIVSAGHLPPIVVGADGRARLLEVEGDPPVGAFRAAAYHEHHVPLERRQPRRAGDRRRRRGARRAARRGLGAAAPAERAGTRRRARCAARSPAAPRPTGRATTTSRCSSPTSSRCRSASAPAGRPTPTRSAASAI